MNLEPCPFCGAKAEMSFSAWQVRCTQCVCTGKTFRTKEQAIDWWNTRKARQPLTDEQVSIGSSIKDALEYALKVFEQLHNTQTYQGDNQDFSDEIITMRAALAELEQAQKQEPAQAVPVAWKHDCAALLTNNVELWIDACPHCGKPRSAPPAIDDETCKMALLIREAVNKGIFQGAIRRDAISILSRITVFHGGENDSAR